VNFKNAFISPAVLKCRAVLARIAGNFRRMEGLVHDRHPVLRRSWLRWRAAAVKFAAEFPENFRRVKAAVDERHPVLRRTWEYLVRHWTFSLTVLVPTLIALIYYGLIASDVYISQSTFLVRSPYGQQAPASFAGLLRANLLGGGSATPDNVYAVSEFILSRDALKELNDKLQVGKKWSSSKVDFIQRFGWFGFRAGFEDLYRYYPHRVGIAINGNSNISTLTVSDFSAERAQKINEVLLKAAEELVNKLNDRARTDLIGYATEEVESALKGVKDAALALSSYRNREGVVNPESQTTFHFELISKLQAAYIDTQTELAKLRALAPQNPNPPALELRAQTLQTAIDEELAKAAGREDSLSSKDAEYKQLIVQQSFAEQRLSTALASQENARAEAQRQQLYLEVVARPILPDEAMEPRRFRAVIVTLVVGLVSWGILTMLIAGIREHQM